MDNLLFTLKHDFKLGYELFLNSDLAIKLHKYIDIYDEVLMEYLFVNNTLHIDAECNSENYKYENSPLLFNTFLSELEFVEHIFCTLQTDKKVANICLPKSCKRLVIDCGYKFKPTLLINIQNYFKDSLELITFSHLDNRIVDKVFDDLFVGCLEKHKQNSTFYVYNKSLYK